MEERLDRVLATDYWISRFKEARVWSLESSTSDHLPIFMDPKPLVHSSRHRRFRFENIWLREADCTEVVRSSWSSSHVYPIQQKILNCGTALLHWGGHLAHDFRNGISKCRRRMTLLRGWRDFAGIEEFTEVRKRFNELFHSQDVFWKQRSRLLWLKEGDMNSRFFHATTSVRK